MTDSRWTYQFNEQERSIVMAALLAYRRTVTKVGVPVRDSFEEISQLYGKVLETRPDGAYHG